MKKIKDAINDANCVFVEDVNGDLEFNVNDYVYILSKTGSVFTLSIGDVFYIFYETEKVENIVSMINLLTKNINKGE